MCVYVSCPWPLWPLGSLSGPSYLVGPRSGVPHLCGSGWGVSGVSWVSGFGGRVCVRGVRRFVCGHGGFGLLLALFLLGLFAVPLGLLRGGEEEGAVHLVEGGAARVFHPNGTVLPPVDTTDGAPLYPFGVGYVDDLPDDWILGTVVLLLGTLGGVGLGGGGGGGVVVAVLGGLVGLGAGTAFVRRAVVVVVGGFRPFGPGDRPVVAFVGTTRKKTFVSWGRVGGGLGFAWGGGGWAVVVDASPPSSSPSLTPPPPMFPSHLLILPPRVPHLLHPSPLCGLQVADATRTPLTTREVSQSWRPRKRARPKGGSRATMRWRDPRGTSWDSLASRQATRMGLAFVELTTTSIT